MVFILISFNTAFSQELSFRNYLEKNGLPSPIVYCIYQDSKGYLWMGTDNGLSRFDGVEFKNFKKEDGLTDNRIKAILEDRQGNIWIAAGRFGVSCFSADGVVNDTHRNSLADRTVYSIVEDKDGKLWFGTSKGLSCFDGKTFRHLSPADNLHTDIIYAIAIEKKGKLWLGTDKGLGCYENENFSDYTTYSAEDGLLHNSVTSLLYDSGGSLWIGTTKGLNRLREGKFTFYTKKQGLIHDSVTAIMEDSIGNTWIGTWNGISLFSGERFLNYSTKNGLPDNFIYSLCQDREGNIWFGTHGGASCLTSSNVKTYNKENGLPNEMVFDIIQDKKGRYWFGTSEGLSCYSRGNFINYTTKDGLISNAVNALVEDRQGNIWIGTTQGLSIFSSGSFTNYTKKDGLSGNVLFELVESRDGTLWIGDNRGLTQYRNGKFSAPPFKIEPGNVLCICEDTRGNLWFSSQDSLYTYSGYRVTPFSSRDGLPGNIIRAIFEDSNGKIWIGTEGGLSCFDRGEFTHYSTGNSALVDNACFCILEDTQGYLWIGNSRGLTCFDGKRFKTYTSERLGLAGRTWISGIKDNHGALWFGSTEGVISFVPPPVRANTTPPPVHISSVKVMEKEVPLAETGRFRYNQNIFRFNYVGLSFTAPADIGYKYMVANIDNDWQFTEERSLFYPFLPPGSYTFKVKAVNSDGFESVRAAEYRFRILPPFWQTWWFLVFLGLVGCWLVILVIQWRVKRVREKAEIRARQVELEARNRQLVMSQRMELMGTLAAGTVHDLKNLMAVIIGYSQVMGQKHRSDKEDFQDIEIIKETAATAVQMAKQILSFARPKSYPQNETVELRRELTEILDTLKVSQPGNIQIRWQPPPEPIHYPIHPVRFQQLVMNICLNACQAMPEGGELTISLSRSMDKEVILEIVDTGTGIKRENLEKIFDPLFTTKEQGKGTGLGLFVVKQVVDEYKGKIEVRSEPGKGTSFVICFPALGW
ncbi:MAG: GHKL domain-containing protein [Candidatus Aminicenantes bacterium]|nr:GHKL domain-containing protein [Candidatus Aminicenantes bacterium]